MGFGTAVCHGLTDAGYKHRIACVREVMNSYTHVNTLIFQFLF